MSLVTPIGESAASEDESSVRLMLDGYVHICSLQVWNTRTLADQTVEKHSRLVHIPGVSPESLDEVRRDLYRRYLAGEQLAPYKGSDDPIPGAGRLRETVKCQELQLWAEIDAQDMQLLDASTASGCRRARRQRPVSDDESDYPPSRRLKFRKCGRRDSRCE